MGVLYPALFPPDISQGYKLNGWVAESKKISDTIGDKVWDIYHSPDKKAFRTRVAAFSSWGKQNTTGTTLDAILKLCAKVDDFTVAYDFPSAHRTSHMIDRHMEPMARFLYSTRYFHLIFVQTEQVSAY